MNRGGSLLCLSLTAVMLLPAAAASGREAASHSADPVGRIAGDDRIATAVELARVAHDHADVAVLATSRNYPDALSGSVLAHGLSGPLLLTEPDHVPAAVLDVMSDLSINKIVLLGGTAAISSAVEADLQSRVGADNVSRIRGDTRFATAAAVAREAVDAPDTVVLATGENYPDAVSVSALAADRGWPVLLTSRTAVPQEIWDYLASLPDRPDVLPVGGPAVIDEAVLDQLREAGHTVHTRAAGPDRYATSSAVADRQVSDAPTAVWVATGQAYPDALAAGAAAAATGGVLHLTSSSTVDTPGSEGLRSFLEDNAACRGGTIEHAFMAGGPVALAGVVADQLRALLTCEPFPDGEPCTAGSPGDARYLSDSSIPGLLDRMSGESSEQQIETAVEIMRRSGPLAGWIATSELTGDQFRAWLASIQRIDGTLEHQRYDALLTASHETIHQAQADLVPSWTWDGCTLSGPDGRGLRTLARETPPRAIVHDELHQRVDAAFGGPDASWPAEAMHGVIDVYFADEGSGHCDGTCTGHQGLGSLLGELNAHALDQELVETWRRAGVDIPDAGYDVVAVQLAAASAYVARIRVEQPTLWDALRAEGWDDRLLLTWEIAGRVPLDTAASWDVAYGANVDAIEAFTDGRATIPPRP